MDKSLTFEPTIEESERLRLFLQQGLAEMDRHFEQMARDQVEIDRLALRSLANLAEI